MTGSYRPPAGNALRLAAVVLTLATAVIHLSLGTTLFVLNGIGYIVLLVLLYAPLSGLRRFQSWVRYALIAYTAITVLLWFPLGMPYSAIGVITKLIELGLIVVLVVEARRVRRVGAPAGPSPSGPRPR